MRSRPVLVTSLLLFGFLAACRSTPPSLEGRFAAAGGTLFLQCHGERGVGPTVLLEHGIGERASSASWDGVVPRVAPDAFVCRFDRAGAGRSEAPARSGRDGGDLTRELRALLDAADVPGPYLLVGHSFGGYPVRLFAAAHPRDVVGVVFVDSVHESIGLRRATGAQAWGGVPQGREALDLERVERAVERSAFPSGVPVVVLTRGEGRSPAWDEGQAALAALSRNGRQRVVRGSGHEIPREDPGAVAAAVRELLEEAARAR